MIKNKLLPWYNETMKRLLSTSRFSESNEAQRKLISNICNTYTNLQCNLFEQNVFQEEKGV